jgi:hypothetical protein
VRTLWKPIGQLSKTPSRPGNCVVEENDGNQTSFENLEEREGKRGSTAHIERVYAPVEFLHPDVFHGAPPVDAINDHLLRLGRVVSSSLQEAPVCHIVRARRGDVNNWESVEVDQSVDGTNVSVWSSFGMLLSEKAGSFCSSSRRTSNG